MRCGCGCVDMAVPNAQWQSMDSSTRASVVINCECAHECTHTLETTHSCPSCSARLHFIYYRAPPTPLPPIYPSPSLSLRHAQHFQIFQKRK